VLNDLPARETLREILHAPCVPDRADWLRVESSERP